MNLPVAGALGGLCVILAGGLVVAIAAPAQPITVAMVAPPTPAREAAPPQSAPLPVPPPAQSFDEISTRSLFHPQRQAFPDTGRASAELVPPQGTLIGVIISSRKSMAILKPTDGGPTASVAVGQDFQGWQLARVDKAQAVFRSAQGEASIALRPNAAGSGEGAAPVVQPAPVPQAPGAPVAATTAPPAPVARATPPAVQAPPPAAPAAPIPSYLRKPTDPIPGMQPPSKTPLAIGNPL